MDSLLEANRLLHIVFASVGLAAWWVPILTKKGGEHHKSFCGYIVGITAVVGASTRLV